MGRPGDLCSGEDFSRDIDPSPTAAEGRGQAAVTGEKINVSVLLAGTYREKESQTT